MATAAVRFKAVILVSLIHCLFLLQLYGSWCFILCFVLWLYYAFLSQVIILCMRGDSAILDVLLYNGECICSVLVL